MRKMSREEHIKNFWRAVAIVASGCWHWRRGRDEHGYGRVAIGRIFDGEERCHRISFLLLKGKIPKGMDVLHKCDNPRCCNPDHLFLGTQADNNADMFKKGRWTPPPVGDENPKAKITSAMARAIYKSQKPYRTIADCLGISVRSVQEIKSGRRWRHATEGLKRVGGYPKSEPLEPQTDHA